MRSQNLADKILELGCLSFSPFLHEAPEKKSWVMLDSPPRLKKQVCTGQQHWLNRILALYNGVHAHSQTEMW